MKYTFCWVELSYVLQQHRNIQHQVKWNYQNYKELLFNVCNYSLILHKLNFNELCSPWTSTWLPRFISCAWSKWISSFKVKRIFPKYMKKLKTFCNIIYVEQQTPPLPFRNHNGFLIYLPSWLIIPKLNTA